MFENRTSAGRRLAERLAELPLRDPVVLALPRGGVPVALPVAQELGAPLDLLLVKKIGVPGNPELAAGAVAEGAEPEFNRHLLRALGLTRADFAAELARKREQNTLRRRLYLEGREMLPVKGRSAVVVDDGIATGATVKAALAALKKREPAEIILAVPVAPPEAVDEAARLADTVVCLDCPAFFRAVGVHYKDFRQVSDGEVATALAAAKAIAPAQAKEQDR